MTIAPYLLLLGVALALAGGLWLVSLRLRDASIVDPYWGPGFAILATVAFWLGDGADPRRLLLLALVGIWGLRLGGYLLWRNAGHGEDYRYAAMRDSHGQRFWWVSLFTVFLLQGALQWFIALPLQVAMLSSTRVPLGAMAWVGLAFWSVGFFFEAVGDWQLARFKADPANQGKVLDSGLWRYTRHPNYFGDAMMWWGLWIIAAPVPGAPWTLLSPALMMFLVMRVSGVTLLEKNMSARPAYRDYIERTSAFFPWPPGQRESGATRTDREDVA